MKIEFFFPDDEAPYASSDVVTPAHIKDLHAMSRGLTTFKIVNADGIVLGTFTANTTRLELARLIALLTL